MLLPKAIAFYRSIRAPPTNPKPLPKPTSHALNLLALTAFCYLLSTLPIFTPLNVFTTTSSRLQTPTNVLFNRLNTLRPLTPTEESLRKIFESGGLDARLQYLRFGPEVLASCPFVSDPRAGDAATSYLLHALPSLLAPHLLHLFVLGLVTSAFAGPDATRWRTAATILGLGLAALDLLSVATYNATENAGALRASEISAFYWQRRLFSRLLIVTADAGLGYLIYATATARFFVLPPSAPMQLEAATKGLEGALSKVRGLGAVRNVVMRDRGFRGRVERYWVMEQEIMREVWEDRDVVSAVNGTLEGMDVIGLEREAGRHVGGILGEES